MLTTCSCIVHVLFMHALIKHRQNDTHCNKPPPTAYKAAGTPVGNNSHPSETHPARREQRPVGNNSLRFTIYHLLTIAITDYYLSVTILIIMVFFILCLPYYGFSISYYSYYLLLLLLSMYAHNLFMYCSCAVHVCFDKTQAK